MTKRGKCICGAVSYEVDAEALEAGICHCGMCRAWTGGVNISFAATPEQVRFTGEEHIRTYASSPWAERAFCGTCGSNLFYRVTADGPYKGQYHIGAGTLSDWSGVTVANEIYIDRKPDAYAFAGERKTMTEAEVMAMFAPPKDGSS